MKKSWRKFSRTFRDPNRIQTYNLLIRSQMLYSVELWDQFRSYDLYFFAGLLGSLFLFQEHHLLLFDSSLLTGKIPEIEDSCSTHVTNLINFD